jgi:hypothetical protein
MLARVFDLSSESDDFCADTCPVAQYPELVMNGEHSPEEVYTESDIQCIAVCWCCTYFPIVIFYARIVVPQRGIDILIVH